MPREPVAKPGFGPFERPDPPGVELRLGDPFVGLGLSASFPAKLGPSLSAGGSGLELSELVLLPDSLVGWGFDRLISESGSARGGRVLGFGGVDAGADGF